MSGPRRIREFEARLAQVWREQAGPALDARWKAGVLHSVRAEASASADEGRLVRNALVLATAVAASVVVGVAWSAYTLNPSLEYARVLVSDPQSLLQLLLVF